MPSPRVLIVDDEQPLARILSFAFENEGYRVDVATDGIDCMNKVATFAPDLVIKLLRQNELHKGMGIAAMSAKTSPSTRDEALAAGADLFLRKPFQIATLVEQVEGLLASKTQKS
jgi:DNA-binding response OmpR family regulator